MRVSRAGEPFGVVSLSKPVQFWRVMRCLFLRCLEEDTSSWTHIVCWIAYSFAFTVLTIKTHSTKTINNVETTMVMETSTITKKDNKSQQIKNKTHFHSRHDGWIPHTDLLLGFWIEGTAMVLHSVLVQCRLLDCALTKESPNRHAATCYRSRGFGFPDGSDNKDVGMEHSQIHVGCSLGSQKIQVGAPSQLRRFPTSATNQTWCLYPSFWSPAQFCISHGVSICIIMYVYMFLFMQWCIMLFLCILNREISS